ncbi:MAG: prephenate dehydratase, partial [bacterium]
IGTAARVLSHPYPLLHATPWLIKHNPAAERVPVTSTSLAAELAAGDPGAVALCNLAAARRNGLRVLLDSLPSQVQNMTRFLCLSKTVPATGRLSMSSLCFSTLNRPGSLLKAIEVFAKNRVNMTRIESRALGSFRSYRFFVELEAAPGVVLDRALKQLRARTEKLAVLGSYPLDKVPKAKVASLY